MLSMRLTHGNDKMKGIILAGGSGTRLYPLTHSVSKQMLPVYDKPAIYYPLSTLMIAGIKEILIISTPRDVPVIQSLLNDGSEYGIKISYAIQDKPNGLAEAFIIGEEFIGKDTVALILGDNIIYSYNLHEMLSELTQMKEGATIFGYRVKNPSDFGVVEFDKNGKVVSLEEKPANPKSDYAIPGLYFYDNDVIEIAKKIKPSARGELEITSVNEEYLRRGKLRVKVMSRGVSWLDIGTYDGLMDASMFVSIIQKRQGLYIACLEEIAYRMGYVDKACLSESIEKYKKTDYGNYLSKIRDEI